MAVKVKGTWKKDERIFNGLESIAADLMNSPLDKVIVVAVIEPARLTTDIEDGGSKSVTVKLAHIEPILDPAAAKEARALLETAYTARTGGGHQGSLFDPADDEEPPAAGGDDGGWDDEQPPPAPMAQFADGSAKRSTRRRTS